MEVRTGTLQPRPGLDAQPGADRQKHLRLARPAFEKVPALDYPPGPDPRRRAGQLARWGFTGLWLIGLWERSEASKRIKQLRGNLDAVASAYSLFDYEIADDLGGRRSLPGPARAGLAARHPPGLRYGPQPHGDRLALGDRTPRLVRRPGLQPLPLLHLQRPQSILGRAGWACIIEDHYYDSTDAAVVFKRVDNWTGERALYLPRQRRHLHALERHRPARTT